jgi:hypothetical protein
MCLNILNRLVDLEYRLTGIIPVGELQPPGWTSPAPFYLFRCPKHGVKLTYAQGHAKELRCLDCFREDLNDKYPRVNDPKIPPQKEL